ncbi:MAG: hypothetical protein Q4E55_08850, partial [Bacteroidales bacterium]|nr:hypothetical protein [Bacteroidales bacterium]
YPKAMITEKMYKMARRIYYVCALLMVPSVILFGWILYGYLAHNENVGNLVPAVIDILLFAVLMIRNKSIMNKYESRNREDNPSQDNDETTNNQIDLQ